MHAKKKTVKQNGAALETLGEKVMKSKVMTET